MKLLKLATVEVFLGGAMQHHPCKKIVQLGGRGQLSGVIGRRMSSIDQDLSAGSGLSSRHDTYRLYPFYGAEVSIPTLNLAVAIDACAHDVTSTLR